MAEHLNSHPFDTVQGTLHDPPPWVFRVLIPLLSRRVIIGDGAVETIRAAADRGPVVYAFKYRSMYDLHYLQVKFPGLRLPAPSMLLGAPSKIGSLLDRGMRWRGRLSGRIPDELEPGGKLEQAVRRVFDEGKAVAIFLVDEKTSRERYLHPENDPIRTLLNIQGRLAASIAVVPLMILYDRTLRPAARPIWESLLGDPDQPGPLRRVVNAMRRWMVPELLVGEPVHLVSEFEEFGADQSWDDLPFQVRQELIAAINARIRVSRGPERLSRTEVKERVLQDERLQRAVGEASASSGSREESVRKKAEAYVDEIAGDQYSQVHHFLYYALKILFNRVFAGIDTIESQFTVLKGVNAQHSLIFVSCHKSHFDYLLIGFLCFIKQMSIPYMAAGKNLSFWPVGPILRNAGAFFLRRSFKGLSLYTHVFAAYVKVLVGAKANINFYIEGGRSRTGKLMPPKLGMLSFLLQAIEEGAVGDLIFIPTFVGYDRIPEEKSYLHELAGRDKEQESLLSFLQARKLLTRSFGKVYVRFHEPVSFVEFATRCGGSLDGGAASSRENRKLVQDFAYYLMDGIVRAGVVTPGELTAAALTCSGSTVVSRVFIRRCVDWFAEALAAAGIEIAGSLADREASIESTLALFVSRGFVEALPRGEGPAEPVSYAIHEQQRPNLQFYKNALVNYLWPVSLLAGVLFPRPDDVPRPTAEIGKEFVLLKQILAKEFILNPLVQDDEVLDRSFLLIREQCSGPGQTAGAVLNREALNVLRGILADLIEVYYLVLVACDSLEADGISQKELMKNMARLGESLVSRSGDKGAPLLPSVVVGNALSRFSELGLLEYHTSRRFVKGVINPEEKNQLQSFLARILTGRM